MPTETTETTETIEPAKWITNKKPPKWKTKEDFRKLSNYTNNNYLSLIAGLEQKIKAQDEKIKQLEDKIDSLIEMHTADFD